MKTEAEVPETKDAKKKDIAVDYNGQTNKFPFKASEMVSELLAKALSAFGVVQNPHMMSLFDQAGQELPEGSTLKKAGVKAGDELILRQSLVKGG